MKYKRRMLIGKEWLTVYLFLSRQHKVKQVKQVGWLDLEFNVPFQYKYGYRISETKLNRDYFKNCNNTMEFSLCLTSLSSLSPMNPTPTYVCQTEHLKHWGTRNTETVHTSAKARLASVAISVPPSGESVQDRHRNLIICSLKISCKSVREFSRKVANRQTTTKT